MGGQIFHWFAKGRASKQTHDSRKRRPLRSLFVRVQKDRAPASAPLETPSQSLDCAVEASRVHIVVIPSPPPPPKLSAESLDSWSTGSRDAALMVEEGGSGATVEPAAVPRSMELGSRAGVGSQNRANIMDYYESCEATAVRETVQLESEPSMSASGHAALQRARIKRIQSRCREQVGRR